MGPGDIIRWAGFRWVASSGDLGVQIHFPNWTNKISGFQYMASVGAPLRGDMNVNMDVVVYVDYKKCRKKQ